MREIGVRALKQNASAVVTEVAAGETITVTDRGRPVAQLVPISTGPLERLIAAGRARPARHTFASLGKAPASGAGLSKLLDRTRRNERY